MAFKKYAYYNKGNKIALIERESSGSRGKLAVAHCTVSGYSTKDTCEAAGGQWIPSSSNSFGETFEKYVSPVSDVTEGLEIEYTYLPEYILPSKDFSTTAANRNFFSYIGWTAVDGYLTFLTSSNQNYSSFSKLAVDSHIVIQDSSRWNGLHKIQEVQAVSGASGSTSHGGIKTYTKVPDSVKTYYDNSIGWLDTGLIVGADDANDFHALFQEGLPDDPADFPSSAQSSFLYISGSDVDGNSVFVTNWKMTTREIISMADATTYMISSTNDLDVTTADTTLAVDASQPIYIYEAFLDPGFIYADVNVLNDESDEVPVTRYQARAIVYYLKAQMAEDAADVKAKEYFMREFKRQLEKEVAAKKHGPSIVQGFRMMRK
tara:strand:+ start:939 stop:2066 length:1128 start_codon:yes stop_codon:yes gene_type:complete